MEPIAKPQIMKYLKKYNIGKTRWLLIAAAFCATSMMAANPEKTEKTDTDSIMGRDSRMLRTSAVSIIGSSDLDTHSTDILSNNLTGKAAGLTVMRTTGDEPGSALSDIFVRGVGTFGGYRTPLLLVDGIERDINHLDPEEVESVKIMKDGAATAIYGQRGANGVVLVTTKRGRIGRPVIALNAQYGFQQPTRLPKFLNSASYLTLYNKALANDGLQVPSDPRYNPANYGAGADPYLFPDVDWYGSTLRKSAPQQQYRVSVRGGSEVIRYYVLFGFMKKDGLYNYTKLNKGFCTNDNYDRYSIRSNLDASVTKTLNISLDIAGRIEEKNTPNSTANDIFNALSTITPNAMPITYADGHIAGTSQYRSNPFGMISHTGYRKDRNKILQIKAVADQRLDMVTPGLSVNAMVAYDGKSGYGTGKQQKYAVYELQTGGNYTVYGQDTQLSLAQEKLYDYYHYQLTFEGKVSYDRTFGNHGLSADVKYYLNQLRLQGDNPPFTREGISGRVNYNYNNRYIADATLTWDGSDEYAPGHRFGLFPSISGAWVISNESFWRSSAMNLLKLRLSYGMSGNNKSGLDRYGWESHWSGFDQSYGGYIFGSGFAWSDGAWEGRIANPNLTWAKNHSYNIGVDMDLFNCLEVSVDAFYNRYTDIVSEKANTTSSIIGAPYSYINLGKVANRGIELSVSHKKRIGKVNYFVNGNISFARNKILAMDEVSGLKEYQQRTGKSVTQLWGLQAIGFYADQQDIDNSPLSTFYKTRPGDIKYVNQNPAEDNLIDEYDEVPIGHPTVPEIVYGLSLGAEYAGFDLSATFNGMANRSVYLNNASIWSLMNNNKATAIAYGAWEKGVREADATFPRLTTENNLNNFRPSSFWIKNGSFLRLGSLEVGYTIPNKLLKRAGISKLRFYFNAQNLFTADNLGKYNLDPEVVDAGVTGYPVTKSFNFGINLNF